MTSLPLLLPLVAASSPPPAAAPPRGRNRIAAQKALRFSHD